MKKVKFTEKSSTRVCGRCKIPLKLNLLAKRPDADLCYRCFKLREREG
jgi:hypothetical protein